MAVTAKDLAIAVSETTGKNGGICRLTIEAPREKWGTSADILAQDTRVAATRANALGWNVQYKSFVESSDLARLNYQEATIEFNQNTKNN